MKTLFISDLHLQASEPAITNAFLRLLSNIDDQVDALYILGDFFEAWIGDDDDTVYHQQIMNALKAKTTAGLKIYFMVGNRDFLIGEHFLQATGCQLLNEETRINLYGQAVLLMHGDTLCTADTQYQRSRKWMRNRFVQKLFLLLPLAWRRKIADRMRQASSDYTRELTPAMMDVSQSAVAAVMRKHRVQLLIHGHTHKPNIHKLELDGQPAARIVLAAWHDGGKVVEMDDQGKIVSKSC